MAVRMQLQRRASDCANVDAQSGAKAAPIPPVKSPVVRCHSANAASASSPSPSLPESSDSDTSGGGDACRRGGGGWVRWRCGGAVAVGKVPPGHLFWALIPCFFMYSGNFLNSKRSSCLSDLLRDYLVNAFLPPVGIPQLIRF